MGNSPTDFGAIKEKQQQTWASGDFSAIANRTAIVGELLCETAGVRPGEKVLDVACGSGNTSIAAARRFADVTGLDYVPSLLETAGRRAAAEGLDVVFREGDAEALPFADNTFDVVMSTFGCMFAPDHERTAAEMLRVCRPGGRIAYTAWTPESVIGELFRVTSAYLPPPPGLLPAALWGSEQHARDLFGAGGKVRIHRTALIFRFPSAEYVVRYYREYYGPTKKTFEQLPSGQEQPYTAALISLWERGNRATDGTLATPGEYLEVTVQLPR